MKIKQIGKHASVVERLRRVDKVDENYLTHLADKIEAIAEALAYIIEKKHAKRKIKLARRKKGR